MRPRLFAQIDPLDSTGRRLQLTELADRLSDIPDFAVRPRGDVVWVRTRGDGVFSDGRGPCEPQSFEREGKSQGKSCPNSRLVEFPFFNHVPSSLAHCVTLRIHHA